MKLKKTAKYIIFNVNKDSTEIIVEKESKSTDYEDFATELPEKECRWAVYDLEYTKGDEGQRNKLCFIAWSVHTIPFVTQAIVDSHRSGRQTMQRLRTRCCSPPPKTLYADLSTELLWRFKELITAKLHMKVVRSLFFPFDIALVTL